MNLWIHNESGGIVDKFGKVEINVVALKFPLIHTITAVTIQSFHAFFIAVLIALGAMLPHQRVEELYCRIVGQERFGQLVVGYRR